MAVGNRMTGKGLRWAAISVMGLLVAGCGDGQVDRLKAELTENKRTIEALSAENGRLSAKLGHVQEDCDVLQSEYTNLTVRERELSQWSQQMAERFGPGIWYPGPFEKPLPHTSMPDATPDLLVDQLNALFRQSNLPQVILTDVNGDTAHVRVRDDRQLTQQMGTAGATAYIQSVTYTLTSLPEITHVDFDFQEGDHAIPGRYSR